MSELQIRFHRWLNNLLHYMLARASLQILFYLEAKFLKNQQQTLGLGLLQRLEKKEILSWGFRYLIYLMFSSSVFSQISWNLNTSDKEYISIDKIPFISIEGYNGVWFSRIPAPFQLCSKEKIEKGGHTATCFVVNTWCWFTNMS